MTKKQFLSLAKYLKLGKTGVLPFEKDGFMNVHTSRFKCERLIQLVEIFKPNLKEKAAIRHGESCSSMLIPVTFFDDETDN
ncbi:hypothetical protein [Spirulina sp. 06S082]|uniref:hypothetical protein n=1 Tax=Spirulina sp. 06S082 TaxID=3110248 RepID=UPI002B211FEE|nr:hypothetical protein [Spirulina sp. 06S082]MEA5468004.1 hypothetical protein [Spirulina sp. 06S082]